MLLGSCKLKQCDYYIVIKMTITPNSETANAGEEVEQQEVSFITVEKAKIGTATPENSLSVSFKDKHIL